MLSTKESRYAQLETKAIKTKAIKHPRRMDTALAIWIHW